MNKISWTICQRLRFGWGFKFKYNSCLKIRNNINVTGRTYHVKEFSCGANNSRFITDDRIVLRLITLDQCRRYAKKKKLTRVEKEESEEESESENEGDDEDFISGEEAGSSIISKNVQTLRVDTILKAGLFITKKKVEKEFYASKLRLNGQKLLKKAVTVKAGDEVDLIIGFSNVNPKLLTVHRVVVMSIGKVTEAAVYPLKLQVFKSLLINNYDDPWVPVKSDYD